ncbi:MAG TPA: TonB-dependent receptor plug domain-containing protein, partial [Steroidobacteraceae bacterium]|nr:TonB-dependent receptor plug domain-containing protein [Steroidobacteraceae bacterium]
GGTSRPRYFQIRGIGELEQYEGAPNPSVGFLIDDIDFSGIAMPAALFDMAQAEILRGPQGTAYGANAIAGLVSLRSQAPHPGFEARGEAEAGDHGTYSGGLVLNGSVGADSAVRLALNRFVSDGYRHNAYLNRDDTNGLDENLARLRLTSRLTPALTANVTALYSDADNGYDAWSIDNSRVTQSDRPGRDSQLSKALALRLDYALPDGLTLRSISTFAHAGMDYSFDGDWGNDVLWGVNGPYDFFEDIRRTRRNFTQELRLSGRGGATAWVVGGYALRMDERYDILDLYNGDVYRQLDSDYRALTLAAYAQADRQLSGRLAVSGGLRVERRAAHYRDSNALRSAPVDNMIGGHLALTWQLREGYSAYAALTRGYKAGGINTTAEDIPDPLRSFDPEFVWNLETGLATRSADGRFDSRSSLFYMRRYHQQVSSSVQVDPQNPLTFVLLTDNAARGENLGVESQLGFRPVPSLRLGASIALLRARFLEYSLEGRDLAGRDDPHAPNYQLGLSAEWHSPAGWFARIEGQAVDAFYFSASHDERARAYQLVNLRLGYERERWQATLYARNLLDEHYAVRGFFFANEPPDWMPKRYIQNGDPRQIGARISFRF